MIDNLLINAVQEKVSEILGGDNSGHGMEHVNRVLKLSLNFAHNENAEENIVALIALLHDVDDYKLFGSKNAEELTNAKNIMNECKVNTEIQSKVLNELKRIGYSKSLRGLRPVTIEGKVVSDADMCDALGVNGMLRTYAYSMKKGKPFFDKNTFPVTKVKADEYSVKCGESSVNHIFEKILKLKDLMMTNSGKKESESRHQIVVDMLYHLFSEEDVPEWTKYLNQYLNVKNKSE